MASIPGIGGGQVVDLQSFYARNATLGASARSRAATIAELYFLSRQYEGKRDWYDKSVPLRDRKPRIIIPLFRETIEAVDRFLWSGHRFPSAVVNPTREADGSQDDDEVGPELNVEQAEQVTRFLHSLIRNGRIVQAIREATASALKTSSAAVIVGVQAGYVNCYVHSGKDCTPKFLDANPRQLESLDIQYQYSVEEPVIGSIATRQVWYWYRRTIDAARDVVYQPVRVVPGQPPQWAEDPARTVSHNLGFCPAVWIRTFGDCSDPIDGKPLIDPALYPMLDAVNYIVSQRQRAVEYGLDPQPFRKGVPEGEREELRKNPGALWELPHDAEVGFLEVEGKGADVASRHLDDLKTAFREAVGCVKMNPEINVGNVSGVALELLHAPLVALASDLRVDLGDDAYVNLLGMALRVVTTVVQDKNQDVWVPGVKRATALLKNAQLGGIWLDPPITLDWPPFFTESEQDRQFRVTYTGQAVQAGLISQATGTRQVAHVFGVEDPAAEQDAIDEDDEPASSKEAPPAEQGEPAPDAAPMKQTTSEEPSNGTL